MRFAIDIIDEAGNNRIYIGQPLGLAGDKLRVQLRDGEAMFDVERRLVPDRPDRGEGSRGTVLLRALRITWRFSDRMQVLRPCHA